MNRIGTTVLASRNRFCKSQIISELLNKILNLETSAFENKFLGRHRVPHPVVPNFTSGRVSTELIEQFNADPFVVCVRLGIPLQRSLERCQIESCKSFKIWC